MLRYLIDQGHVPSDLVRFYAQSCRIVWIGLQVASCLDFDKLAVDHETTVVRPASPNRNLFVTLTIFLRYQLQLRLALFTSAKYRTNSSTGLQGMVMCGCKLRPSTKPQRKWLVGEGILDV